MEALNKSYVSEEAAVREIVSRVCAGWNVGSGEAFAAPFAEDADYVIIDGRYIKGRPIIAVGHQQIFDTVYKGSHNTAVIKGIRFLRDDVALVHVQWDLSWQQGENSAISTLVLTKEDGSWGVAAFQNTRVERKAG
jgi:uncharacterized protein (TIGR02246 family)